MDTSPKNILLVNKHSEICLTLLINKEMQIKCTVRYYYTPTRKSWIKKTDHPKCQWNMEEVECSAAGGMWNSTNTLETRLAIS